MAGIRDIAADIAAAEAGRTLQGVGPTVRAIDQDVRDEAFRAIADGRLNGELAVALWHRLYATEEVRTRLLAQSQPARDAVSRVTRAFVTPTHDAGATKE